MILNNPLTLVHNSTRLRSSISLTIAVILVFLFIASSAWYVGASKIPRDFPLETNVVISEGMTHQEIAEHLETLGVISSSLLFQTILSREYSGSHVQAGTYRFTKPLHISVVAEAVIKGDYQTPLMKITFPEGFRVRDFKTFFKATSSPQSLEFLTQYEGRLFPDTYFIKNSTTVDELVDVMRSTYESRLVPLRERIEESPFTEEEILILASILEREANDETSMRMVSGVLHNRLKINMPLQVDAVFEYLIGKTSEELTQTDLDIDSPYNTYTNIGFPPTPICNPGMLAIEAALSPTAHSYLYYLTDSDGMFHYANTFDEHRQNKARYLR